MTPEDRYRHFVAFAHAAYGALTSRTLTPALAATSTFDDLRRETAFLDMTLPPPGPVTKETIAAVRERATLIAAHAFRVAEEIAARPVHVPKLEEEKPHV